MNDGLLDEIGTLVLNIRKTRQTALECVEIILENAESITDDKSIPETVKDAIVSAALEAKQELEEL